ncbi:phosphohydrolase [Photobacterium jeanii]|uniref:Phosphohydrolase n=1 Tax=Photobacterium jeanii TaxID=858640 RepID=A0A178K8J4_9GAMM|nr:HD domain-containing protein [Photobacterium jeanii]OAN13285.1 phosphohydrolase [Photobacterium jeanii]PST90284.1 HD domain-containing protein [Photobacterium jeanii]
MLAIEAQCEAWIDSLAQTDAAHDKAHIQRVVKLARQLGQQELADLNIVLPAAWLHDCITMPKDHPERHLSSQFAADAAIEFLVKQGYPEQYLAPIHHAIMAHSFSANIVPETLEAKVVQDADRLDALGAIGVSRCMQISGILGSALYSSDDPFCRERQPDDKTFTIDHFYVKLFKIAETLNTQAAKQEAEQRVSFMKCYLDQLEREIV